MKNKKEFWVIELPNNRYLKQMKFAKFFENSKKRKLMTDDSFKKDDYVSTSNEMNALKFENVQLAWMFAKKYKLPFESIECYTIEMNDRWMPEDFDNMMELNESR